MTIQTNGERVRYSSTEQDTVLLELAHRSIADGKTVWVTIDAEVDHPQKRRTHSQNDLMWALFRQIADELSTEARMLYIDVGGVVNAKPCKWSPERVKELLGKRFYGTCLLESDAGSVNLPLRTSKMSKGQMTDFIDRILEWMVDHSIMPTVPDDSEYMELKRLSER